MEGIKIDTSGNNLLKKARPLFVCGCDRSGTTAVTDYLNRHQEILICQERYKERLRNVHWDLFSFERIMDFSPQEVKRPGLGDSFKRATPGGNLRELFIQIHADLLAEKDPAKLRWIGDKGPFYVRWMDVLAGNNPGARFIVLYRPIEEVAASWEARAKNPDDYWPEDRGIERAVKNWNIALRKTREFVESNLAPRLLIVSYHDFFYRTRAVVPLIQRFLGLEFDKQVTDTWRETTLEHESRRQRKESLSEEQRSFIKEHADREAEAWVLKRIEQQWRVPALYVEESTCAKLALLEEFEARAWRLKRNLEELRNQNHREVAKLRRDLTRVQKKNRNLTQRLQNIKASSSWRLLNKLSRLRARVLRRKRQLAMSK